MSKQPEALRLVSMLDGSECCKAHGGIGSHPATCDECPRTAAAELRRLHALNVELVDALRAIYNRHNAETMAQARVALSKAAS